MIVFDLEWNQGYDNNKLNEVIEIGAIKVDMEQGRILDSYSAFIRPTVHKKMMKVAKELPQLPSILAAEEDFQTVYPDFLAWCGDDTVFAAWGPGDFLELDKNADYWKLPRAAMKTRYDLQRSFGLAVGAVQNVRLSWAVSYCNLPDVFDYHDSLYDSLYAYLVCEGLSLIRSGEKPPTMEREKRRKYHQISRRLRTHLCEEYPCPKEGREKTGGRREDVLNERELRCHPCPICGVPMWVSVWQPYNETVFFSRILCSEHGAFLCRAVVHSEGERWKGKAEIPTYDRGILSSCCTAYLHETPMECRRKTHSKRRREHDTQYR